MAECFKCGISDEKSYLFDVISSEGIVKICRNCQEDENLPTLKRPSSEQIKNSMSSQPLRDRLALSAGVEKHKDFRNLPKEQQEFLKRQNTTLKDIVDKNFKLSVPGKDDQRAKEDLIDHFHWVVMRARRARKITTEQLAEAIGEPEAAIKLVEQGVLRKDSDRLLVKLESFLNIRLYKTENARPSLLTEEGMVLPVKEATQKLRESSWESEEDKAVKELTFDKVLLRKVTVSDLKEIQREQERDLYSDVLTPEEIEIESMDLDDEVKDMLRKESVHKHNREEKEDLKNKKDLTEEEMDDLIFGRG